MGTLYPVFINVRGFKMKTVTDITWNADWECPACNVMTDQCLDHEAIEEYDGAIIRVTCPHDVDNGDEEFDTCGEVYFVDLRG